MSDEKYFGAVSNDTPESGSNVARHNEPRDELSDKDRKKALLEGILEQRFIKLSEDERELDVAAFPAIKRALETEKHPTLERALAKSSGELEGEPEDERIPRLFEGIALTRAESANEQQSKAPEEETPEEETLERGDFSFEWQEEKDELDEDDLLKLIDRYRIEEDDRRYRAALKERENEERVVPANDPYNRSLNDFERKEIIPEIELGSPHILESTSNFAGSSDSGGFTSAGAFSGADFAPAGGYNSVGFAPTGGFDDDFDDDFSDDID